MRLSLPILRTWDFRSIMIKIVKKLIIRFLLLAVTTAQRLVELLESDREKINKFEIAAKAAISALNTFRARPLLTINEVCKRSGLTFPSASKAIDNLIKLGIIEEITGRQRNRIFVYKQYLSIMSEGTELI